VSIANEPQPERAVREQCAVDPPRRNGDLQGIQYLGFGKAHYVGERPPFEYRRENGRGCHAERTSVADEADLDEFIRIAQASLQPHAIATALIHQLIVHIAISKQSMIAWMLKMIDDPVHTAIGHSRVPSTSCVDILNLSEPPGR